MKKPVLSGNPRDMFVSHSLFRDLDSDVITEIASLGSLRKLDTNQLLFSKGDEGDALYGVVQGRIRISNYATDGREMVINVIEPGELFGEIALLDGGLRTADATAMEGTELLQVLRADFVTFLESRPAVASHFLKLVCERLRATTEMLEDSAFLNLSARLAKRLVRLAENSRDQEDINSPLELKISQSDLGQLMGVSRESINKSLQGWRRDNLIDLGRGKIIILDVEGLEELIEEDAFV